MKEDPYWSQKRTKLANQRSIMAAITARPSTFGELTERVGLSRPILSKNLRELEKQGIIERRIRERRIEYDLTEKGRGAEELRKRYISDGFQLMKQLTGDFETAKTIHEIAKLAKEDPALVEATLGFSQDFLLFLMSEDTLRWMTKHPRKRRMQILREAIQKRIINVPTPQEPRELYTLMNDLLDAMREVVASDRSGAS
jgi:DNA-binding MarR family transcriptional regulator